jgi:hypothetical protein
MISIAWKAMLDRTNGNGDTRERMSRERRKKLTGRDYTASVMVEMLEVNGQIDHELYKLLETARKARNSWAHDMKSPTDSALRACSRAVEQLFKQVLDITISLQYGGRGGVPQWPIWLWEEARARDARE